MDNISNFPTLSSLSWRALEEGITSYLYENGAESQCIEFVIESIKRIWMKRERSFNMAIDPEHLPTANKIQEFYREEIHSFFLELVLAHVTIYGLQQPLLRPVK